MIGIPDFHLTRKMLDEDHRRRQGEPLGSRCTCRSTIRMLNIISDCMLMPGQWREIKDHHPHPQADRLLASRVKEALEVLGFNGFEFKRDRDKYMVRMEKL